MNVRQHSSGARKDHVEDLVIRGHNVAYSIMRSYDAVILVEAMQHNGEPGTVYAIELIRLA